VRALSQGGLYKAGVDLFGMVVPMLVIYKLYGGQAKELWNTPRKEKLQMVVMAVLWVECISGLLHITLDNPAFQSIPYLGAAARDFQWHHKRPTHICHQTWHEFLGAIDGGIIFLFVAASFIRPKAWSRSLSIFALIAFPLFYLMMASHRWSHIRRDQLPPAVALLQSYGILLSQDAHSVHHANYDQNFSLMTGWSNPFINWACIHVMKPRNTHWVGVFAAWTLLPFWAPFVIEFAKKRGFALPCSSADRSASKTTQA
jgi:ubiquitin-conjugating enzyme E2 variant